MYRFCILAWKKTAFWKMWGDDDGVMKAWRREGEEVLPAGSENYDQSGGEGCIFW